MDRHSFLLILLPVLLAFPTSVTAQQFSADAVARDAETAFRAMMEAWDYDQRWRMWDMGSQSSQMSVSQNDFADQVRVSTIKPAAGKQVEGIRVYPQSATQASIQARSSLENHKYHRLRGDPPLTAIQI